VFQVDKMSLREAVKHFDVSRPTLQKSLKEGKISGVQDGKGQWQVDPSELARVYRPRAASVEKSASFYAGNLSSVNRALPGNNDAEVQELKAALEVEKAKREAAEALAEERARHIEDLRRMLPPPEASAQRKRWWPW
jgi:predicted site-specific integrase-resolvase